jgi:hypothetical protein
VTMLSLCCAGVGAANRFLLLEEILRSFLFG